MQRQLDIAMSLMVTNLLSFHNDYKKLYPNYWRKENINLYLENISHLLVTHYLLLSTTSYILAVIPST